MVNLRQFMEHQTNHPARKYHKPSQQENNSKKALFTQPADAYSQQTKPSNLDSNAQTLRDGEVSAVIGGDKTADTSIRSHIPRVRQLEVLIEVKQRRVNQGKPSDHNYQNWVDKLDALKREYVSLTGREYK